MQFAQPSLLLFLFLFSHPFVGFDFFIKTATAVVVVFACQKNERLSGETDEVFLGLRPLLSLWGASIVDGAKRRVVEIPEDSLSFSSCLVEARAVASSPSWSRPTSTEAAPHPFVFFLIRVRLETPLDSYPSAFHSASIRL